MDADEALREVWVYWFPARRRLAATPTTLLHAVHGFQSKYLREKKEIRIAGQFPVEMLIRTDLPIVSVEFYDHFLAVEADGCLVGYILHERQRG